MPSLHIQDITEIKTLLKTNEEYPYFLETGTLVGDTLHNLRPYFERLRSVELLPQFYEIALRRKADEYWYNIELYHGDSSILLPTMLEGLDGNIIFFLDGHRSGGEASATHKDVPLLDELQIIKNSNRKYNDIVIIDDFGLFGTANIEDWREITLDNVKKILDNRTYHEINNRLIITSA